MSRRPLGDELRELFDRVSEPAHPALAARIRHEIAAREAQPAAIPRSPRLAAVIAAVVAIAVVAGLVLADRQALQGAQPPTGAHPAPVVSASEPPASPTAAPPSPAPGAGGSASAPPSTPAATPSAGPLPAFTCAASSGAGPSTGGALTAVRAASQSGYDRFVLELDGPVPAYQVRPQASPTFTQDASGLPVTLAGSAGLTVTLQGSSAQATYTGPTDLKPAGTATLREARQVGDFEGVLTWGLGVSHPACYRAFTLDGPSRLVIDVQR